MFWMGRNLKPNKSLLGAESQFAYDVYQQVPGCLDIPGLCEIYSMGITEVGAVALLLDGSLAVIRRTFF